METQYTIMTKYIPDTNTIRESYKTYGRLQDDDRYKQQNLELLSDEDYYEEFDRWLNNQLIKEITSTVDTIEAIDTDGEYRLISGALKVRVDYLKSRQPWMIQ